MPIEGSWNTVKAFFLTQVNLEESDGLNTFANESLWYVQYFLGQETIEQIEDKFYLVQKPEKAGNALWIPSSLKTAAYFLSALIWVIPGTIARLLSIDSEEVRAALLADRVHLPPPSNVRKIVVRPRLSSSHPKEKTTPAPSLPASITESPQAAPPEPAKESPAPSSVSAPPPNNPYQKAWSSIVNNLASAAKAAGKAATVPMNALEALGFDAIKPMMEATIQEMLQEQIMFTEELLQSYGRPDNPNYTAVETCIKKYQASGKAPFYTRDLFVGLLPVAESIGVCINPSDLVRWEELDHQCQIFMHTRRLRRFMAEKSPVLNGYQAMLQQVVKNDKAKLDEMVRKEFLFFTLLEKELKKEPLDRLAILKLLNSSDDQCNAGAIAFYSAKFHQALNRFVKNFFPDHLAKLYLSCLSKLHAAKFSIPSPTQPLAKDLLEQTLQPPPAPSSEASASQTPEKPGKDDLPKLCQYLIAFEEMLLQKGADRDIKLFIEGLRKDPEKYGSPFFLRNYFCYVISDPEMHYLVKPEDWARWEELDIKFQMVMNRLDLRGYLDEEVPAYWNEKGVRFKATLQSVLQNRRETIQREISSDGAFFKDLFRQLLTPNPTALEQILVRPETRAIFSRAREYSALRGFTKGILDQQQYDEYCSRYMACITKLCQLNFKIPYAKYKALTSSPET
ncbi:MAG: hypothetical protein JSS10_06390 [Verrucomicrobia bacterium]|nr:hypothetical protein [Verrucomicrobiota bacterium]